MDPSDQVFMLKPGTKPEQKLFEEGKKAGFTGFSKEVDMGGEKPVTQIFFKKKLDIKAQGGSF